jgi:hypothetical protein
VYFTVSFNLLSSREIRLPSRALKFGGKMFESWKREEQYKKVVKALAASEGRKPCNCGMAIADKQGNCEYGCGAAQMDTMVKVGGLVTEETLCRLRRQVVKSR